MGKHKKISETPETERDEKEVLDSVRRIDESIEKHPLRKDDKYTPAWQKP